MRSFDLRYRICSDLSSPGVPLPNIPAPTHAEDASNGLVKYRTIRQALHGIPTWATDHQQAPVSRAYPKPDHNADFPLNKTIKTTDWPAHFGGNRPYTVREVACLQGFPHEHCFFGSKKDKKRQVGNAVPPSVGMLILDSVRIFLLANGVS